MPVLVHYLTVRGLRCPNQNNSFQNQLERITDDNLFPALLDCLEGIQDTTSTHGNRGDAFYYALFEFECPPMNVADIYILIKLDGLATRLFNKDAFFDRMRDIKRFLETQF